METYLKTSRFKIQRKLGVELPGLGKPGALERRDYPPGQHGNRRRKFSDFALRLEEKQKIRMHYVLREEQLRRFIRDAKSGAATNWTAKLIGRLERRLDNLVFRLNFAPSIPAARQMVSHGHVFVNGKKATIPSMVLKPNDTIELTPKGLQTSNYLQAKQTPRLELADFLVKEDKGGVETGRVRDIPGIDAVPFPFDPGLFTEYYAQRKV